MEKYRKFPDAPDGDRYGKEAQGIKSADEYEGREHHQVIPIEDAAGGAAFVFHNESEGAPDEDTYEITNVKNHRNNKHYVSRNDA